MKSEVSKRANYKAKMPFDNFKLVTKYTDSRAHMQSCGNEEGKKFYSQSRTIFNSNPVKNAKCLSHLTPAQLIS